MDRTEYLLTQFGSECNETAHRVTKALQFGLHEVQPGQLKTNATRIFDEYIDLLATLEMLIDDKILDIPLSSDLTLAIRVKKAKVEKFYEYAKITNTKLS